MYICKSIQQPVAAPPSLTLYSGTNRGTVGGWQGRTDENRCSVVGPTNLHPSRIHPVDDQCNWQVTVSQPYVQWLSGVNGSVSFSQLVYKNKQPTAELMQWDVSYSFPSGKHIGWLTQPQCLCAFWVKQTGWVVEQLACLLHPTSLDSTLAAPTPAKTDIRVTVWVERWEWNRQSRPIRGGVGRVL